MGQDRRAFGAGVIPAALLSLALVIFSGATSVVSAQQESRRLVGTVLDALTGTPLASVSVSVEDTNLRTATNASGVFTLDGFPRAPGLLRVALFGYEELLVPVNGNAAEDSLVIHLQSRPIAIDGLEVVGSSEVNLTGVVLDAASGAGLPWARIRLGDRRAQPTDSSGAFRMEEVPVGSYLLLAERLGYESLYVPVTLAGTPDPLAVALEPNPMLLQGIAAMTNRIASRRNAYAFGPVRSFDEARLHRSAARDAMELLGTQGSVVLTPCVGSNIQSTCVATRGRPATPRVFIDEVEVQCGLTFLATYSPSDFFLLEVYDRGAQIRAYTREYMERTGRNNRTLIPADLLPPPMGGC